MKKPLENVRVLDLSRFMAGPVCGKILADLGADVIKVEPPWGDEIRFQPPLVNRASPMFLDFNRGKRGLTLNLKTRKGVEILKALARDADVVVENFSVGTMERLGLGYEVLKGINPHIILVSITGFGQYGPRSRHHSFDMIGQATSGFMHLNGKEASEATGKKLPPLLLPDAMADSIPGSYAALGVLAALNYRSQTGRGQWVDVAQQDVMMYISNSLVLYPATGVTFLESIRRFRAGVYDTFQARDGYVAIAAPSGATVDRLKELLGAESVTDEAVIEWVKTKTVEEAMADLVKADIPASPIFTIDDVVVDPQAREREMFVEVEHPGIGRIGLTGVPLKFSETPLRVESRAPTLGQHNDEILGKLGYSLDEVRRLKDEGVI